MNVESDKLTERAELYPGGKILTTEPVESFLENLTVMERTGQQVWFHYVAIREIRESKVMSILKGQVLFLRGRPTVPATIQLTDYVQAGCFELKAENGGLAEFLNSVSEGDIIGELGKLGFHARNQSFEAIYAPSVPEAPLHRWSNLSFRRKREPIGDAYKNKIDWELKAARVPYDTINEVALIYKCGPIVQDYRVIDIVAPNVAAIAEDSSVKGTLATVQMNIWNSLDESKAALGYRVVVRGECVERGVKAGTYFSWRVEDNIKKGIIGFNVPVSSLVHCYAIYDGVAQHSWFIGDRSNSQNARRIAFESFDPALSVVSELLAPTRKARSREFESGIAALFWMLGFGVVHLNDPKHGDAVDLIATAPDGSIALIECTTGLLKEDSKLANLVSRVYSVRQRLDASGSSHVPILPIIVTSKSAGEIAHEVDGAHKQGIAVMAQEDVLDAMNLTVLLPDPDQWFKTVADHIQQRKAQLET